MDIEEVYNHSHTVPSEPEADPHGQLHQELDTAALELAYEKCLHQQHVVQEAERHRRLRVQLLLLEDHNDNLQAQIADDNDYVHRMEENQDALRVKFTRAETSLETTQAELRIKNREIETLKVAAAPRSHCECR